MILDNLKKAIKEEAQKSESEIDIAYLMKLVQDLSNNSQDNLRFTVDSGIISRLGEELVGKQETAICELIKNSYDADATYVNLTFYNDKNSGERIEISDNGSGMTREQLANSFMRLGTADKIIQPYSKIYKRKKAGRKGIGRIASQRLGSLLTVRTKAENHPTYELIIDWSKVLNSMDLFTLTFPIKEINYSFPKRFINGKDVESGTILIINHLTNSEKKEAVWRKEDIKKIYKYIADLMQPEFTVNLAKENDFSIKEIEKNLNINQGSFVISCFTSINGILNEVERTNKIIYDYAVAEIDGQIDEAGYGLYKVSSNLFGFEEGPISVLGKDKKYNNARLVKFKAFYYIQGKAGLLSKGQNSLLKEYIEDGRIGIRIYRNGFRILPYAEKGNDWLGLDVSYSDRKFLFPHSNDNFLGFVSILDPDERFFKETSSREGLLESDAFLELKDFCYAVIVAAGTKVAEFRGRKSTSSQKEWKSHEAPIAKMQRISTQLVNFFADQKAEIKDTSLEKVDIAEIYDTINDIVSVKLSELSSAITEQINQDASVLEELGMLRVLATLGITVAEFTHEMRQYIPALEADILNLNDLVNNPHSSKETFIIILDRLYKNINSLITYINLFDRTAKENVNRRLESLSLIAVVNEFVAGISSQMINSGITCKINVEMDKLFTRPMHYSELVAVLYNLYTNAIKAIYAANVKGKILINCGASGNRAFIEMHDNGIGIPKENETRIFDSFFTTTNAGEYSGKQNEDLSGSGLGLWIVRQILDGYGGEVKIYTPQEGYITCFRIELPLKK